jgi:hypothetical protein
MTVNQLAHSLTSHEQAALGGFLVFAGALLIYVGVHVLRGLGRVSDLH